MIRKLGQLYRCTKHVPKRQLMRRIHLIGKRRFNASILGSCFRRRSPSVLPVAANPPRRLFPPRCGLVRDRHETGFELVQLGDSYPLRVPMDWELRQNSQATHLQRLALHYHESLESLPFALGRDLVLDWIAQNPPYCSGYWLDSWNSYAVSIRCVCWMQWLAENQETLTDLQRDKILTSLVEQVHFLESNLETDIGGNHLIKNIKCLVWAGCFFSGKQAEMWATLGRQLLQQEIKKQLLQDGLHFELSPAYHCQVFADLVECASLLEGVEQQMLLTLMKPSAQAICDLTHPDGYISLMSDGGLRMVYSPEDCLAAYETLGAEEQRPRSQFGFANSGYYGARSDRTYFLADCGPLCADALPAHGHADMLAFEWDVDGKRCIVDAGVYEYESGRWRELNRSTRSHNTVTVGRQEQCELVGSFRTGWRAHAECQLDLLRGDQREIVGKHSAFRVDSISVEHHRTFKVLPLSLEVYDDLDCEELDSPSTEVAIARLLFSHEVRVLGFSERRIEAAIGKARFELTSSAKMTTRPFYWSPDFGQIFETLQVEILYGPVPCQGSFCLRVLD